MENKIKTSSTTPDALVRCMDSPHEFVIKDENSAAKFSKFCSDIPFHSDPKAVCDLEGVKSHCPVTCGSCPTYKGSDSTLGSQFADGIKVGFKRWFRCSEINTSNYELMCSKTGVSETCSATCTCPLSESVVLSPTMAPSATTLSVPTL